ncbi:prolyl-tRNA synthetase [Desulforamulus reducens MI-1]|uniref:Proline--tRNA ligase n=1 Tax=Desulforamulus reducens (strain ATCC BAA-1160 / DSM 100696 / MI-1) TaxID=349161 RepID=SYP_DESRM|nr:proline--tRNA ligase [Desulforamulus reducens]A4J5Y2.1 RecName: Full=Proline--tRNA ligase; AltName: Full=Prolyl-tRNA synthetase; Short=ProRS [Desulforamulus reducens MI-1]ABO50485.1 prolyl-tRNA synthetase [Desulforamulus reducens MI-1]
MRVSQMLVPTLREVPAEAEVVSHQLLLRAGFIRKTASGVYTYLPLAQRVLKKLRQIIREEIDKQGGQELLMPIIQPAEMWLESGRWHVYGPELFRLKDRHDRNFCLGPTHEEVITILIRGEVRSYKQMPLLLYQIQNKYRDERRPRFGLLRGREFIMKDLYSFDRDEAGLDISYQKMHEAYTSIFSRCGVKFRPVEADSGAIGGSSTHEFMVLAESGEAAILYCSDCDYAANVEKATTLPAAGLDPAIQQLELQEVSTPGKKTAEEVAKFLGVEPFQVIKTMFYKTDKEVVAALVRGDRDVNEIKLLNVLGALTLDLADESTVQQVTGAPTGYVGPVGLENIRIVADMEVMALVNAVVGANKQDAHLINVNPKRDFQPEIVEDIRMVKAGEPCPKCGAQLLEARGIEVGQIFKLGTKYSKALGATFLDENGKEQPIVMGCYGIGVSRTMAAAIEQNYDKDGIIWPASIAPYQAIVIPVAPKDDNQMKIAEELYKALNQAGVETILDDRSERPGVKFKDADLIGYPLRIVVGNKAVTEGVVEIRQRRSGQTDLVSVKDSVPKILEILPTL